MKCKINYCEKKISKICSKEFEKFLEKHGIICAKDTLLSAFGTIEEIEYGAKLSFLLTEKNKTGPLT